VVEATWFAYKRGNRPVYRISHPRSLDAHQPRDLQPGFCYLLPQLPGPAANAVSMSGSTSMPITARTCRAIGRVS
jgi:hypothetical protein